MERKYVHANGILYIGKEANNIDEEELELQRAQTFLGKKVMRK